MTTSSTRTSASARKHAAVSAAATQMLVAAGYTDICVRQEQLCAVREFNYTTALLVGLDPVGYERRYCYEHRSDAQAALRSWDGTEHPPGPWIKCKGAGWDLLNPQLA